MKATREQVREMVFSALFAADGDRAAAAKALSVSPRTLDRYISEGDLYGDLDRMGWIQRKGPPRGAKKTMNSLEIRVLELIRAAGGGNLDYAAITKDVYGVDEPQHRVRVHHAVDSLRKLNKIAYDDHRGYVLV